MSKENVLGPILNKPVKPTRRRFIAGAGLAAAGAMWLPHLSEGVPLVDPVAANLSSIPQFRFTGEPARQRKSFHDLTDAELVLLCKAISQMKNGSSVPMSMSSPRQWDQWVAIHERHCTEDGPGVPQVHWSWFFLPWHRAYLWFLERHLGYILTHDLGLNEGQSFALPYWDWITRMEIPNTRERETQGKSSPLFGYNLDLEDMVNNDNLGFDNGALWDGYRGPTLQKPNIDPANEITQDSKDHVEETLKFIAPDYIQGILGLPFEYFAGKPVISQKDGQGVLEIGPHNDMHDWVGSRIGTNRDMGTLRYAALDPIFFMHHANIDRIWSWYRKPQPDPDGSPWGSQSYVFADVDGSPVSVTVRDVIKSMTNVTYVEPQSPSAESLRLLSVLQTTSTTNPVERSETLVESAGTLGAKPLTVAISQKDTMKTLLTLETRPGVPPLSLLEIETGAIAYAKKFSIRVFVNMSDADRRTSITDSHYVGRIGGLDSESRGNEVSRERGHTFPLMIGSDSNFYKLVRPGEPFKITLVLIGPSANDQKFSIQVKSIKLKVFE
jgi:polyphenol oxidase